MSVTNRLNRVERECNRYASTHITQEKRDEVARLVKKARDEYNSPEAVAERRRKYEELQRIVELREQAELNGEPMDKYPLPWETEEAILKEQKDREEFDVFIEQLKKEYRRKFQGGKHYVQF